MALCNIRFLVVENAEDGSTRLKHQRRPIETVRPVTPASVRYRTTSIAVREGEALGRRSTQRLIEQRIAANGKRSVKRNLPADPIG